MADCTLVYKGKDYTHDEFFRYMDNHPEEFQTNIEPSITKADKIIFAHPGSGKTFLHDKGNNNIIDFDSTYKEKISKELGIAPGFKARNEWRKEHKEEWNSIMRKTWEEAKADAKKSGKILLASDMILLREFPSDFDKVVTMSSDTFVNRAKQREDYTPGETEQWKANLDTEISKMPSNKVINSDKYLSELLPRDTSYQLKGTETSEASPKTIGVVKEFLNRVGFKIEKVSDILDDQGNKISANGAANMLAKVIHVVDGAEAKALPEEAMHVVTRLVKEQDTPIYDKMMSGINKYKIFDKVLETYSNNKDYQTSEGKPDIVKLKEEAVGKVLAEYVIRDAAESTPDKPELIAKAQTWWERIKDGIRNMVGRAKIDVFEQVAKDFNKGAIEDKGANLGTDRFLQQTDEPDKAKKLFEGIQAIKEPTKVDEGKGASHYEIDGKTIKNRVTDFSKKYLENIFRNKPQLKDKINEVINDLKKSLGTGGHADIEHIFENYIDPKTGLRLTEAEVRQKTQNDNYISKIDPADMSYYRILEQHLFGYEGATGHIPGLVDSFPAGTRFLWEKKIYDPKRDLAGTVDFMAITPDGKVNLFDWKFIGKLEANQSIRDYMKRSYDMQMDNYIGVLKQQYGVTDIGQVRIIPISVKYADDGKFESLKIGDANYTQEKVPYLLPYPTKSESTGIKKLDSLVTSLSGLMEQLQSKAIGEGGKEARDVKIRSIENAILSIRLNKSFGPLLDQADLFNTDSKKNIEMQMNNFRSIDFSKLSTADMNKIMGPLNETLNDLSIYKDLASFVDFFPKDATEEKTKLIQISAVSSKLLERAQEVHSKYLQEYFKNHSIEDILTKEQELGKIGREAYTLSKIQSRTGQAFYDINNQKNNIVENESNNMVHTLEALNKRLKEWGGGGADAIKKAQNLIEAKDKNGKGKNTLIPQFKSEFYESINRRFTKGTPDASDIEWIKANVDRKAFQEWADSYRESRIEAIKNLRIPGERDVVEQKKQFMIDEVNRATNLDADYAWSIPRNVSRFPKSDLWESKEYKELSKPENAPAKALYDEMIKWNKVAAASGYIEYTQVKSFMPWVAKSLAEKIAIGGRWNVKEHFLENLTQVKRESLNERRDSVTGELISILPKMFTTDISTTDKEGNQDYSRVSDELVKNLALFAHSVIDYKAKSDIEELTSALLDLEKYKGMLESDSQGKLTGRSVEDNANFKYLEDAVKMHLYGETTLSNFLEAKGGKIELNGVEREFTTTKALDTVKTAYSLSVLGFNMVTSVFRAINTNLQGIYTAGNHYTTRQQLESFWDFCALRIMKGSHELAIGMLKDFLPVEENLHESIKEFSANKISGADFQGIMMKWVKSAHNIVQYTNYLSHVKNAIIVDGKIYNARDYYRNTDEYKNKYNVSAEERQRLEKGFETKIQELIDKHGLINNSTFNKETGRVEYKGLDLNDPSVAEWKSLIRVSGRRLSGNISEADQSHMRSNALLRQTMLFSNWLPQQLDIRFGELAYNKGIDAYEYGRTRMMVKVLFQDGILNGIKNLTNMYKANEAGVQALHNMYVLHAKEYQARTGSPLNMTPEEFYDMVRDNIRVQSRELLTMMSVAGFALGLFSLMPDKKDQDESSQGYYAFMKRVMNRSKDELQLYYNPTAFLTYADGAKIPALGYISDAGSAITSVLKEGFGIATGNKKMVDGAHAIKHLMHPIPVAHAMLDVIKLTDPEMSKYLGLHNQEVITTGAR